MGSVAICFAIALHGVAEVTEIDPDTVVGLWLLDEGEGAVATDSSGRGNDGTIVGEPAWVNGISGSALEFDGEDDQIIIPSSAGHNLNPASAITIALWMKRGSTTNVGHFLIGRMDTTESRTYYFAFWNDGLQFEVSEDGTAGGRLVQEVSEKFTDTTEWHHLAATFAGGVAKIYIDGVEADSSDVIPTAASFHQNDSDVRIGWDEVDGGFPFHGLMDDIVIMNVAASAANVAAIMEGVLRGVGTAVSPAGKLAATWGTIKQR
jgi:hypothetical protein